jgi:hypothetical protein
MLTTSLLPLLCLSSPGLIRLTMISEALVSVSECVERSIQCPGQRGSRLLFKRKQIQLLFTTKTASRDFWPIVFLWISSMYSYCTVCVQHYKSDLVEKGISRFLKILKMDSFVYTLRCQWYEDCRKTLRDIVMSMLRIDNTGSFISCLRLI